MLTLLVADIFGNSQVLQQLAREIAGNNTVIIDPYSGEIMNFSDEQIAYQYFSEHVGLTRYAEQLKGQLQSINQPFNLIAFSVGGAATWLISEWLIETKINRVVCFYASQIRHHQEIRPVLPIELILPKSEIHFDVLALKTNLSNTKNVMIKHSEYLHGFMNQLSPNYSPSAYQGYLKWLKETESEH